MTAWLQRLAIFVGFCGAGCASASSLPTTPSESVTVEGYLSSESGLRIYSDQTHRDSGSKQDCIQVLRRESIQTQPIPDGRVRVVGRLAVFDDIFELATIQMGSDYATHELCEARYLITQDIIDLSRDSR